MLLLQAKPADTLKPQPEPEPEEPQEVVEAREREYGVAGRGPLRPVRINDELTVQPMGPETWIVVHEKPWAAKLRARHIGDFTRWSDRGAYRKTFERLLRDLEKREGG